MWGTRKLLPILVGDQHSRKLYGEKILNIYIKLHIKCLLSNLGNKKIFVNFEEQNSCRCMWSTKFSTQVLIIIH